MPIYTFDLTVDIEADDIDQADLRLDEMETRYAKITGEWPSLDNPPDFPLDNQE